MNTRTATPQSIQRQLDRFIPNNEVEVDAIRGIPGLIEAADQIGETALANRMRSILEHPDNPELWDK